MGVVREITHGTPHNGLKNGLEISLAFSTSTRLSTKSVGSSLPKEIEPWVPVTLDNQGSFVTCFKGNESEFFGGEHPTELSG